MGLCPTGRPGQSSGGQDGSRGPAESRMRSRASPLHGAREGGRAWEHANPQTAASERGRRQT
eukprot:595320-Alexandrium_andersonii.AAC.1